MSGSDVLSVPAQSVPSCCPWPARHRGGAGEMLVEPPERDWGAQVGWIWFLFFSMTLEVALAQCFSLSLWKQLQ